MRVGQKYKLPSGERGVVMEVSAYCPETYLGHMSFDGYLRSHRQFKIGVAVERGNKIVIETIYVDRPPNA